MKNKLFCLLAICFFILYTSGMNATNTFKYFAEVNQITKELKELYPEKNRESFELMWNYLQKTILEKQEILKKHSECNTPSTRSQYNTMQALELDINVRKGIQKFIRNVLSWGYRMSAIERVGLWLFE